MLLQYLRDVEGRQVRATETLDSYGGIASLFPFPLLTFFPSPVLSMSVLLVWGKASNQLFMPSVYKGGGAARFLSEKARRS